MNGSWNESGSVIGGTSFGRVCEPQLTTWNQLLTAGFGVVFCLSVCGNALVMVTIVQQKWMRTVTNVYLLNLAVSDLLLIVICMPPTLLGLLLRCFIFGHAFCRLVSFLQPVSVTASAYTLAVIALERYFAICKPLSSRHWQTKGHAVKMIALVWTIAIVSNISSLVVADLKEIQPGQFNCAMADWMTPQLRLLNNFFVFLILFLLPLLLMVGLYGLVIRNLWLGIQLETQGYPATPAMSRFYPSPSHPSLSAHSLLPSELESQRASIDEVTESVTAAVPEGGRRILIRIQKSLRLPNQRQLPDAQPNGNSATPNSLLPPPALHVSQHCIVPFNSAFQTHYVDM